MFQRDLASRRTGTAATLFGAETTVAILAVFAILVIFAGTHKIALRHFFLCHRPTGFAIDTGITARTIGACAATFGATVLTIEFGAEQAVLTIGRFGAAFFTKTDLATGLVATFAVVVFVVATDLGSAGVDGFVVVIAILHTFATATDPITIFVEIIAGTVLFAAFVYATIAIVVFLVAALFDLGGKDLTFAGGPFATFTTLNPCTTDAFVLATVGTGVTGLGLSCSTGVAIFVGFAVTVVIYTISTEIAGRGQDLVQARPPATIAAGLGTTATLASSTGCRRTIVTGASRVVFTAAGVTAVFVNATITVVILFVVADFRA